MKMAGIREFRGRLKVLGSGLRIGGSSEIAGIGETDSPILRHPISHLPYVPGSSIKGKIRCLLEQRSDSYRPRAEGGPCACGDCIVCQLFGCGEARNTKSPSRLVFRDCQPATATREIWEQAGMDSEVRTHVSINRVTGAARKGALVTMERVPAGSDFDFSFSLRTFDGDDVSKYYTFLAEGFELLSKHYLGGSGSRGYGEVLIVAEDDQTPMHDFLRQQAKAG